MLKPQEIAEISLALWYLPLEKVEQVKSLVFSLRESHGYKEPTDDSDEWTEEDIRDAAHSLRSWDEEEEKEATGDAQTG